MEILKLSFSFTTNTYRAYNNKLKQSQGNGGKIVSALTKTAYYSRTH